MDEDTKTEFLVGLATNRRICANCGQSFGLHSQINNNCPSLELEDSTFEDSGKQISLRQVIIEAAKGNVAIGLLLLAAFEDTGVLEKEMFDGSENEYETAGNSTLH